MGVLADWQIREQVKITPFEETQHREGVISYGVTSYGYDIRLAPAYKVFSNVHANLIDPKNFNPRCLIDKDGDYCDIPNNSYLLGESIEHLVIPRDILAICVGKSTYARSGIIVNVTPLEPEWKGKITIEISNSTGLPARVYGNEGIMQVIFLRTDATTAAFRNAFKKALDGHTMARHQAARQLEEELKKATCEKSYADKKGKYQDQPGCIPSIVH